VGKGNVQARQCIPPRKRKRSELKSARNGSGPWIPPGRITVRHSRAMKRERYRIVVCLSVLASLVVKGKSKLKSELVVVVVVMGLRKANLQAAHDDVEAGYNPSFARLPLPALTLLSIASSLLVIFRPHYSIQTCQPRPNSFASNHSLEERRLNPHTLSRNLSRHLELGGEILGYTAVKMQMKTVKKQVKRTCTA
jgi:hypothetical protein